jgi:hypothetical protein
MPVPNAAERVYRRIAVVQDPITGLRSEDEQSLLRPYAGEQRSRSRTLPAEIYIESVGQSNKTLPSGFYCAHGRKVQMLDDIAERRVDVGGAVPDSYLAVDSGAPEIRDNLELPVRS